MTVSRRACARILCLLACALALAADAQARQSALAVGNGTPERRTMPAMRLDAGEEITLDGALDEGVWQRAVPAGDFIQVDPDNGRPATEPTEVRVVFDADALYIGVTAFDSEPDKWLGYQRRRDEFIGSDDRFMWTIDTFLDERSGYFFEMNPSGLMADSIFGVNGDNRQWDGIWNARVQHTAFGWTIEIEIPFRTLNFNPESDTWGMNFQRTVRRKNEDSIWMGWARNQGLRRMNTAGHVTGIRDVSQGRGLDIKPYGLVTAQAAPARGERSFDNDANAGLDAFYNPSPLLRAVFTVNTDFAQTEVDQRQVNLTRFSLFFPERRDFFLDGSTFFDFASPGANAELRIIPFFSRRIGLGANAQPQQINFGTKLTGQVGGQDVGVLHVSSGKDDDDALVGEEFTVARIKRRMLSQSYVGAMLTRRDARLEDGPDARYTAGLDARFGTTTFLGSEVLEGTAWYLNAGRPGTSSGHNAFGGQITYPNDLWNLGFYTNEVQENFDPAVGFVTRRNYRRYSPGAAFQPRPPSNRRIRRFIFSGDLDIQTDLNNVLLTRKLDMVVTEVQFHSQEVAAFEVSTNRERLDEPFAISPTITLPFGAQYDFTRYIVRAQTANRRKLAVNGRYGWGNFYSGTRDETVLNLTLRMRPGYIVYLTGEWNTISLAEGRFRTRLYRLVGETQFTPFIALVNNFQYDSQSSGLGWQSRFRWIMRPGNDLYVVYTHNWQESAQLDRFTTQDKRIASKVLYTHRF
jgi:hypothetical protein